MYGYSVVGVVVVVGNLEQDQACQMANGKCRAQVPVVVERVVLSGNLVGASERAGSLRMWVVGEDVDVDAGVGVGVGARQVASAGAVELAGGSSHVQNSSDDSVKALRVPVRMGMLQVGVAEESDAVSHRNRSSVTGDSQTIEPNNRTE